MLNLSSGANVCKIDSSSSKLPAATLFSNPAKHFDVNVDMFPTSICHFYVSEVLTLTNFCLKLHDTQFRQ